jgi:hypothetical protein
MNIKITNRHYLKTDRRSFKKRRMKKEIDSHAAMHGCAISSHSVAFIS